MPQARREPIRAPTKLQMIVPIPGTIEPIAVMALPKAVLATAAATALPTDPPTAPPTISATVRVAAGPKCPFSTNQVQFYLLKSTPNAVNAVEMPFLLMLSIVHLPFRINFLYVGNVFIERCNVLFTLYCIPIPSSILSPPDVTYP